MTSPSLRQELAQLQMPQNRIPKELRCNWEKAPVEFGSQVYHCEACQCWTANLPLYRNQICPARDRRKYQAETLGDRRKA